MKILVAKFQLESNEFVGTYTDLEDMALSFNEDAIKHMQLGDVFKEEDIELIPVLCADGACNGVLRKNAFMYLENRILNKIKENLKDLDGIYYHLHGASFVEEIGSGEQHLLKETRKIVGPYLPIAISCDPHGNLTKEYVESATIIRSYRHSPHTDIKETVEFVCKELIGLIKNPKYITPVYEKLPLILGGEQSVSLDEPIKSFNLYMDEVQKDERILSVSWHVGYLRHDCSEAGAGIVVVPSDNKYREFAKETARKVGQEIFNRRKEFHYTGLTAKPDKVLEIVLDFKDKPIFITDSGDNVTSGARGANTYILRQFLDIKDLNKRVLFAAINDIESCQKLYESKINEIYTIDLGMSFDELSASRKLEVKLLNKGRQEGTYMYGEKGDYGPICLVNIVGTNIDVAITNNNHSFVEIHQLNAIGINIDDYDVIVVKQGYIHPEEKEIAKLSIMSLTEGATIQDTKLIKFKRIMRPMYPIDEI